MESNREEVKITQEEADTITGFIGKIQTSKIRLADIELQRDAAISEIKTLQKEYVEYDKLISHKYGKGVQINLQTRIVTSKDVGKEEKKEYPN